MAYKIVEVPDEEMLNDEYLCPKCGGGIVDGCRMPDGDYDDWVYKPHCVVCGFESGSNKRPYEQFVPIVFEPETAGAYIFAYNRHFLADDVRREYKVLPYDVTRKPGKKTDYWGFGGSMYDYDTRWIEVTETVAREPGESDDVWHERRYAFFEALLPKYTGAV